MRERYKHIIQRHHPKGYKLIMRPMTANNGIAQFERSITVDSLLSERHALFVFLHECGHVHNRHLTQNGGSDTCHDEYEADQYAIKAMKAEGVPIPRKALADQKAVMREYIEAAKGEIIEDAILKYAYGKSWRKHR